MPSSPQYEPKGWVFSWKSVREQAYHLNNSEGTKVVDVKQSANLIIVELDYPTIYIDTCKQRGLFIILKASRRVSAVTKV